MTLPFNDRLRERMRESGSLLCVGLDPDPSRMGGRDPGGYLADVIEATTPYACAFKPNLAFFEQLGPEGDAALRRALDAVPPEAIVIGDAKRGDIGHTAEAYARALFDRHGFDAVTANPYGGGDAVAPFLAHPERGCFVWCRSSNPGGADLQELQVTSADGRARPLYAEVAALAVRWNTAGNAGLVAGATRPGPLRLVREVAPELPILVPGVGAQGGDVRDAVLAARDRHGLGFLIASSRSVLYASAGSDYAHAAAVAARALRDAIADALAEG